LVLRRRGGR